MFRAFPLPIIRGFLLYNRHWYIGQNGTAVPFWPFWEAVIKPARNTPMSIVQ